MKIQDYLNGLDNIVQGDGEDSTRELFCDHALYGHFVIVINKMMGTSTDPELARELLEPEPGLQSQH